MSRPRWEELQESSRKTRARLHASTPLCRPFFAASWKYWMGTQSDRVLSVGMDGCNPAAHANYFCPAWITSTACAPEARSLAFFALFRAAVNDAKGVEALTGGDDTFSTCEILGTQASHVGWTESAEKNGPSGDCGLAPSH